MRSSLRFLVGTVLVVGAYWNLWSFSLSTGKIPSRESDEMVIRESQFLPIHYALIREKYFGGNIGYVTARSLKGEPRTEKDDPPWAQLRYAAIPLTLVRDIPDTLYILGDFTGPDPIPEVPENFIKLFDPGNGLVLYKRKPPQ